MDELDILVPHFRLATERWREAPMLSGHYEAVRESYNGGSHGLIATVKSFIECVCLTILGEFGKTMPSPDPSTTDLLIEALKPLGLENSRGASKVDKVLSAHNRLADALSEMRNANDPIAHGKNGFIDTLTANERRAFLLTADTILALVLSAHAGTEPDLHYTREPYDRFAHLHERVDRTITAESVVEDDESSPTIVVTLRNPSFPEGFTLRVEPSRLLYAIDRLAYIEFLSTAGIAGQPATADVKIERSEELRRAPEPEPVSAETVSSYDGILAPLKKTLGEYLVSLDLPPTAGPGGQLVDSLLAAAEPHLGLDWAYREPLLAGIKVALRRTFIRFGIGRAQADAAAAHVTTWLRIQASRITSAE